MRVPIGLFFLFIFTLRAGATEPTWLTSYDDAAAQAAEKKGKLILSFETEAETFKPAPDFHDALEKHVLVRLPTSHPLYKNAAFSNLGGYPGLILADYKTGSGVVVETVRNYQISANKLRELLGLPKGFLTAKLKWETEYFQARRAAAAEKKMLLIVFEGKDEKFVADDSYAEKLASHVLLHVPMDYQIEVDGKKTTLLEQGALVEMGRARGIAIIDLKHEGKTKDTVVSVLPWSYLSAPIYVAALLDLPKGTLTQRSLVWAVRTHPEGPLGSNGSPTLLDLAESHSDTQASSCGCFHSEYPMAEIVAMRGPAGPIVPEAIRLVQQWRNSGGHWAHLRAGYSEYGFDMKRGRDGWYATGIFR